MDPIPSQLRRKANRALHKAALAIAAEDWEAKKKYLAEAELWIGLLREAGEKFDEVAVEPERCEVTEDLFQ